MPSTYALGGPRPTPDILGALGTARRALSIGSPGIAVPLSGIVSPKAEAMRYKLSLGREVKNGNSDLNLLDLDA